VGQDVLKDLNLQEEEKEEEEEDLQEVSSDSSLDANSIILTHISDMGLFYVHESSKAFYVFVRKLPGISCGISPPQINGIQLNWHATPPPDAILCKTQIPVHEFGWVERDTKAFITSPQNLATGQYKTLVYPEDNAQWLIIEIPWAKSLEDTLIITV
jgi:hypothetical protein